MEEHPLHEYKGREFFRDKSRTLTHTTDTVIVSRFDEMKTGEPHEERIVIILLLASYSTVTLFARFCGLSISRPSFFAIPTLMSQSGMSGRNGVSSG